MKKALQIFVCGMALNASATTLDWHQWDPSVGNGHFYLVTEPMTWSDANTLAQTMGGYLASFAGLQELDFVRATFGRTELFWSGLSTTAGNGVFEWSSGEAITFTYFGAHTPDPSQSSGVVFNMPNARGFTRGEFYDFTLGGDPVFRAVIETSNDPFNEPTVLGPQPPSSVPDGGTTAILLGVGTVLVGCFKRWRIGL